LNRILAKIRKGIQRGLASPDSLIWSFDGQERGGEPFHVFLDLKYRDKYVVVEWRSFWGENVFGISLIDASLGYGCGPAFSVIGVDEAVAKAIELLGPNKNRH
jgi:hypothetical protein